MNEQMKRRFGRWLADLREASPYESQDDVAREMGRRWNSTVTGPQISKYETGATTPEGSRFWELMEVYGVTYEHQPPLPTPEPQARLEAIEEGLDRVLALALVNGGATSQAERLRISREARGWAKQREERGDEAS